MAASSMKLPSEKSPAMGHYMNWKYIMMVKAVCSSREVGRVLLEIMICIRAGSSLWYFKV
jgi:hypothetical protein